MSELPAEIVADILERIDRGESTEQILASYPDTVREVRTVLATVDGLGSLTSRPYVATKQKSLEGFLDQAAAIKTSSASVNATGFRWSLLFRRLALSLAAVVLLLFSGSLLASSALPGDFLYGPKRTLESLRMSLTSNGGSIEQLREAYQAERLEEVQSLLRLGRTAEVEFEGVITELSDGSITVSDLNVLVTEETRIFGTPELQALVRVNGTTANGVLFAREVTILASNPLPDQEEPEPTPLVQTPEPTRGDVEPALNTPLPSPTETATPTPTTTPTPEPTASPTPIATASPTDDVSDDGPGDSSGPGSGEDGGPDSDDDDGDDEIDDDGDDHEEPEATDEPDEPEEPEEPEEPDDD